MYTSREQGMFPTGRKVLQMDIVDNQTAILEADDFESVEATISDVGVMYLLLTTIYTDKPRIVVQEYSANARDAHRSTNTEHIPFDIQLPTYFSNEFIIRDYGPGIPPESMENVFIRLGSSTKRTIKTEINGQYVVTPETSQNVKMTGGFGIGAKSAFCYTDNFTVESYVDGIVRTYSFVLGGTQSNGNINPPKLLKLDESPTTEPNGVKIIVTINPEDRQHFINNVYKTTQFWTTRPNIINASTNTTTWKDFEVLFSGANWMYLKDSYGTHIVVDGIPYEFNINAVYSDYNDINKYDPLFSSRRFIFMFDAGDVSINPNREGIQYDNNSIIRIRNVIESAYQEIKDKAQSIIDAESTLPEIKKAYSSLDYLKKITGELKWRGIDLYNFRIDRRYFTSKRYGTFKRKISTSNVDYSINMMINRPMMLLNDEPTVNLRRIKTLLNRYDSVHVLDMVSYDESFNNTEEEFDRECSEYEKNVLSIFEMRYLSEVDEYIKPKVEKIPGNIYKFNYAAGSSRDSWNKVDVDYSEVSGYYVQFERGEAKGYTRYQLSQIKQMFKIDIYGVPERFIGKVEENEDMIPLKEYVDDLVDTLKEKVETVKDKLFVRTQTYSTIFDRRKELMDLGLDITSKLINIPEVSRIVDLLGEMEMMTHEIFDDKDIKDTINFLSDITKMDNLFDGCAEKFRLNSIIDTVITKYPMLAFVDRYQLRNSHNNKMVLDYIEMVNNSQV